MSSSIKEIGFKFFILVILSFIAGYFQLITIRQGVGIAAGMSLLDIIYYFYKNREQR
ncbi:hypothetical protein [Clostridium magnum]|uniref:Uncharacterized protein n=1 Tax=Clostridium magnum DSM 2767 TaxID=1121326 RepID=A0A162TPG6_9CLOT|nr:hypothetical protein [Clostridium magnum]KZL92885.1 hypothetical protein CLMAG_26990 [Clostridium magnum DSM 2767]SHI28131.1 hypothetical protein SAMN02745944_03946 [Clostridium magnum DSM 2767]